MQQILSPQEIVQKMMEADAYSQWLGIKMLDCSAGACTIEMKVRPEMVNGFGITHGGISFSFADSALAFACNSQGRHAVSIETSVNHLTPIKVGDVLTAVAKEQHLGHRLGYYQVEVFRQDSEKVALFKGVVYRKEKEWLASD